MPRRVPEEQAAALQPFASRDVLVDFATFMPLPDGSARSSDAIDTALSAREENAIPVAFHFSWPADSIVGLLLRKRGLMQKVNG